MKMSKMKIIYMIMAHINKNKYTYNKYKIIMFFGKKKLTIINIMIIV